jgi:DNA repair protein RecO (recombination protein O)
MLIRKPREGLELLTESKLERRFRAGEQSLERLQAGYYLAELLRELTHEGDPQRDLFEIADRTHRALHQPIDVITVITAFEAMALRVCGHFPLLDRCCGCSRYVSDNRDQHCFSLVAGGILCDDCRSTQGNVIRIHDPVRRAWMHFSKQFHLEEPEDWNSAVIGELRSLASQWLSHVLGHRLRIRIEL